MLTIAAEKTLRYKRNVASVIPNLPTDSLYKFIAIFGLVLLGFGLWLPERSDTANERQREAYKARQLAEIRLKRKKEWADRSVAEFQEKSTALRQRLDALRAEDDALQSQTRALGEEAGRVEKAPTAEAAKELKRDYEQIAAKTKSLLEKIRENKAQEQSLTEELKPVREQVEEMGDDLRAETVELETFNEAIAESNEEAKFWEFLSWTCALVGTVMVGAGFELWYRKVQVLQDQILRAEAAARGANTSGSTVVKPTEKSP